MSNLNWEKVETIIDQALDLPEQERETFIDNQCGENQQLKSEVTLLLESIFDSEGWLEDPKDYKKEFYEEISDDVDLLSTNQPLIGKQVGSYSIREKIGEGGMGTVYRAERSDGKFNHQVAIKIIRRGRATDENIHRFQREQRILAGFNHPNIARLFDGGITDDGFPYIIMEHVSGRPIDDYCKANKCSIDKRIILFEQVLEAIRYAHENLIIHRDLKPDNILVDEDGNIKILDFGISKLLDEEDSTITQTGARLLTPRYAAPEQIRQANITTATDLYALGIVFYELLTGAGPYKLEGISRYETEQMILNEQPPKPSSAVSSPGGAKKLKGDLDAIALKAIRKEPEQRYRVANEFLDDLKYYQIGLPVSACEDSFRYRSQKFFKRHKQGVIVAVGILLLIIGFAGFYTFRITEERDQAKFEAQKAEQVTEFLTRLFESNDPAVSGGQTLTAKDLLDRGKQRIDGITDPAINANMLLIIGRAYHDLGFQDTAEAILNQAIQKNKKVHGFKSAETAAAFYLRGSAETLNFDVALPYYRKAYHINSDLFGPNSPEVADVAEELASSMRNIGKLDSAEYYARKAINIYRRNKASIPDGDLVNAKAKLAYVLRKQKKYQESERLYLEAIDATERTDLSADKKMSLSSYYNNLAFNYRDLKRYEDAEFYLRKSLKINEEIRGEGHATTVMIRSNLLKNLLLYQSKPESALKLLLENVKFTKQKYTETHWRTAQKYQSVGQFWIMQQKYDKAQPYFEKSVIIYSKSLNPNHIWTSCARLYLAASFYFQGENKTADSIFEHGLANLQQARPNFRPLNKRQIQKVIEIFKNKSSVQYQKQIEALRGLLKENTKAG